MWAVRMETYLEALDLWEAVEEDLEIQPLPSNPTVAQMKSQKEKKTKKSKEKACLFAAVSSTIFTRIMSRKSAKEIWDYLKGEYEGDERIRGMQVLNLIRDFELQKMKESESVKEYSDRLLSISNKVRLLGSQLTDSRILLNALQAQEQRRAMRQDGAVEGALLAKHHESKKYKKKKHLKNRPANGEGSFSNYQRSIGEGSKKIYPTYQHCGKKGHPPFKCWRRPDARCTKCSQLCHEAVICKIKPQQHDEDAKVVDQEEEDKLFVATCFTSYDASEHWLIDSGCTNHMTHNRELFKELRITEIKRVRIGNDEHLDVKGKGDVAISSYSGTKIIANVLFVPQIDQNLLSVGQLLDKGYKVLFKNKQCLIQDVDGRDIFKVKMKGKSFALNLMEEEHMAFKSKESVTEI
ncbi:hypothetical protein K2173_025889 [Erythroxylum novogranatense]|uniref:Retrovirus-related Pol polyprotein from transposon TNT 1-94-like beta-barrel domain-containing protein n=1 Tax=Erythroxylum novogranatense TaxID=1862640 RepID=A0AAV8SI25_9ROSI|nr:hypothetical protein K2173_025889 [Erythroxylum novogranatense]